MKMYKAFVVMPFDKSFDDVYRGIEETAKKFDVITTRLDEKTYVSNVNMVDKIFEQIDAADFIIADMTGQKANVLYEVGYAHGLNKLMLFLTKDDLKRKRIPFDLSQRRHIVYKDKDNPILKLKSDLPASIKDIIAEVEKKKEESSEGERKTNGKKKNVKLQIFLIFLVLLEFIVIAILATNTLSGSNTKNGVKWSNRSSNKMNWADAVSYCNNLNEGGYTDWRLPTISELRTTIKNCPESQPGGSCRISDSCLAAKCWSENCRCNHKENNGGYYSKLGDDDKVWLWSSSVQSDNPDNARGVFFDVGGIGSNRKSYSTYVRCVR